ncbi:MAG: cyclic nucleotide-binding domain-containing protein, partial [Acidobacteriota bacterium]|nr:cyclic nucleotide-binding domain-containing protein [Acidobacteriota bacterium]
RERIWYAFQRENIEFAYPTRTLHIETKPQENVFVETDNAILERLNNVSIFSPLGDEEIEAIAAASSVRVFAPNEKIVRKGQKGNSMFVIHRGSVFIQSREAGKPKKIKTLHEGEFFGEMGLFTGEPRTATVVAEEETEVLEINHLCLKPILEENPELVESFSRIIEERRAGLTEQQTEQTTEQKADTVGVFNSIRKFFGLKN